MVLSQCRVYWINFQNIYIYLYILKKTLLHTFLMSFLKSSKVFSVSLRALYVNKFSRLHRNITHNVCRVNKVLQVFSFNNIRYISLLIIIRIPLSSFIYLICSTPCSGFEIPPSSHKSPEPETTHVKHNCASLCDIVKEQITNTWSINETQE